jgi:hypothetical protein
MMFFFPLNRTAVSDLNNKYKHCLITCKQLSTQEELVTRGEMKGVPLTADKLLYLHAIELCLNAASLEFFGKAEEVSNVCFFFFYNKINGIKFSFFSVLNHILKLKFYFTV